MRRRILANIGFLLQICGMLLIIPILVGLAYNERSGLIAVSLGCVSFLITGFIFNALCERKELDYKSSCILILLAFVVMPMIGSIPYMYLDPFNSTSPLERFTNSFFESVSGFTTTGFSLITEAEALPKSFLLFRSMTEFIGGVGVVFILLIFFHSESSLNNLGSALGLENISQKLKRSFSMVLLVYGVYVLAFSLPVFFLGFPDAVKAVTLVIDTLTGGFSPSQATFQVSVGVPLRVLLLLLMLLGSLNFRFNYYFLARKFRKAVNEEVKVYIFIIVVGSVLFTFTSSLNLFDSIFHVISMSSSTGFDYVGIASLGDSAKTLLMILMLIGGCGASMAGGVKVFRLMESAKGLEQNIRETLSREGVIPHCDKASLARIFQWNLATDTILLFLVTLVVLSLAFSLSGVSFWDSVFEVGSALTTNGISMGATGVYLPVFYKFVLIAAMVIGRVEIMIVLVSLYLGKPIFSRILKAAGSSLRQAVTSRGKVPLTRAPSSAKSRKNVKINHHPGDISSSPVN